MKCGGAKTGRPPGRGGATSKLDGATSKSDGAGRGRIFWKAKRGQTGARIANPGRARFDDDFSGRAGSLSKLPGRITFKTSGPFADLGGILNFVYENAIFINVLRGLGGEAPQIFFSIFKECF